MTCPGCGRWAAADPETGYDADDYCPECKRRGLDEEGDDDEEDDSGAGA